MSEKQKPCPFREDPAGWMQVGLGIAAFDVAFLALADLSSFSTRVLQASLGFVTLFILSVILTFDQRRESWDHTFYKILITLPVILLLVAVFDWVRIK